MRRDQDVKNSDFGEESEMQMLSSEDDAGTQILTQAQSLVEGSGAVLVSEYKPVPEVDYLQVGSFHLVVYMESYLSSFWLAPSFCKSFLLCELLCHRSRCILG